MDNYDPLIVLQVPGQHKMKSITSSRYHSVDCHQHSAVSESGNTPLSYFVIRRKLCNWLPHKVCIEHRSLWMLTRLLSDWIRPRVPGPKRMTVKLTAVLPLAVLSRGRWGRRGLSPAEGCLSPPLILCQAHRHMLLHPAGRSCTRSRVHCLSVH